MPGRTTLFIGILVLAVSLPYLLSEDGKKALMGRLRGEGEPLFSSWVKVDPANSDGAGSPAAGATGPAVGSASQTQLVKTNPTADLPPIAVPPLGGPPGISLAEALRFDVTPAWIAQSWPRVTTRLPTTDYHGVRVPLVTGTELHDFAGSLSYYFNSQRKLERITLSGYTGDYESVVVLIQSRFGLAPYATVGTALYLGFQDSLPISVLRIEEAALQHADGAQMRYHVELELNLPRPGAKLSDAALERLRKLREAKLL